MQEPFLQPLVVWDFPSGCGPSSSYQVMPSSMARAKESKEEEDLEEEDPKEEDLEEDPRRGPWTKRVVED